jgi:tetratricopeptide (TPR) repeat protein
MAIDSNDPSSKKSQHPSFTPVVYRYLRQFQEDPTSKVFAPLAEAYRKSGLLQEALKIAREGLLVHPHYMAGKVSLARVLFDLKNYQEVVDCLAPAVRDFPDNLAAQRLLGDSYLMLGDSIEALNSYKMVLYFNPGDQDIAKVVHDLETRLVLRGSLQVIQHSKPSASEDFQVSEVKNVTKLDPKRRVKQWTHQVELLQSILQRVERYRLRNS